MSRRKEKAVRDIIRKNGTIISLESLKKKLNILLKSFDGKFQGLYKTIHGKHPLIFNSILEYINENTLSTSKFSEKVYRIISDEYKIDDIPTCICGVKLKFNTITTGYGYSIYKSNICSKCNRKLPLKERWIRKLGEIEGLKRFKEYYQTRKGFLSLDYFNDKYGKDGQIKYDDYWKFNFSQRSKLPYSKISQELFWEIYQNLTSKIKKNVKFAELNGEKNINFNMYDKKIIGKERICMFVDFSISNQIVIEFDGNYWHKYTKDIDIKKNIILQSKGYKIFRVEEKDYIKNKEIVIKKCIEFIEENYVYSK